MRQAVLSRVNSEWCRTRELHSVLRLRSACKQPECAFRLLGDEMRIGVDCLPRRCNGISGSL
jgi:hypothetical protein